MTFDPITLYECEVCEWAATTGAPWKRCPHCDTEVPPRRGEVVYLSDAQHARGAALAERDEWKAKYIASVKGLPRFGEGGPRRRARTMTYRDRYGYPRRWAILAEVWWRLEHSRFERVRLFAYPRRKAAERRGAA